MKRLALLLVACAVIAVRADDYEAVLQKDRLVIQEQINKINAAAKKALDAWPVKYIESLKGIETQLKKAGNLEGVLTVRKEVDRFSQKKQITDETVVEMPEELRELQIQAMKEPGQIELRRNMQTVMATDEYVAILDELKKRLTKKGNVEQALVLHKETERAKKTAEYTAAKFVLDAAGVEASVPKVAGAPKVESVPKGGSYSKKLPEGVVLYYTFDKDDGNGVADASGNDNDGQVKGAMWTKQGNRGGAYKFDGKGTYVDVSLRNPHLLADDMTFSLWFNADKVQQHPNPILLFYGDTASGRALYVHATTSAAGSGDHAIAIGNWVDYANTSPANVWGDNMWHMLTVTRSASEVRAYLDGKLVATQSPARTIVRKTLRFSGYDTAHLFAGRMDDVAVFGRVLSETEIKTLYNAK